MSAEKQLTEVFYTEAFVPRVVETKGEKEYFLDGYLTTGEVDLVGDIITRKCMDSINTQLKSRTIKVDYEHESMRGKNTYEKALNKTRVPLGVFVDAHVDQKGNFVSAKLNPGWKKFDEKGNTVMEFKDIWKMAESGFLDAFSIAYGVKERFFEEKAGKQIRLLDDVALHNGALTGNPVNPSCKIKEVFIKSLNYLEDKDMEDNKKKEEEEKKKKEEEEENNNKNGNKKIEKKSDEENNNSDKKDDKDANAEAGKESGSEKKGGEELKGFEASIIELKGRLDVQDKKLEEIGKVNEVLVDKNNELKGFLEKAVHKALKQGSEFKTMDSKEVSSPLSTIR